MLHTRSSRVRLRAALLVALVLGIAAAKARAQSPEPAPAPAPRASLPVELTRALRALRDPAAAPIASLANEGADAARSSLDALFDVLANDRVPALDDASEQMLSEPQRELVLELLERAPRAAVLAAVQRGVGADPELGPGLASLDAISAVGGLSEMQTFFGGAQVLLRAHGLEAVEPVVERGLERLLRRSEHAGGWLLAHWRELDAELLPILLRAVGAVRDPSGLELFSRALEVDSPATPVALAEVRRIGPSPIPEVNERLRWLIRPMLDPDRGETCRAALFALGELRDVDSIPRMIELLELEERGLRDDALWALHRASGRPFPAQPALWRSWYESETRWYAERYDAARDALLRPDPAAAAAALRELGDHRVHPERIAEAVTGALGHASPTIRVLGCRLLAQLALPACADELRRALEDPDAQVAAAAAAGLARMGVAVPEEEPRPDEDAAPGGGT